ncbi:MAG: hypothetical protein WAW13_04995 [Minisyncoccia bacterium]
MNIQHSFAEEDTQILSVTPPLFQLSALPGDIWQSSIKVVNGNKYPLNVYAEVVNFSASGEAGQGRFSPIQDENNEKSSLASWITISKGPYTISPEQTTEIPFYVEVPDNAPPGGHYAAILVSTEEPKNSTEKLAVKTSQAVTALFFVRIEGDVNEEGSIREFRVIDSVIPTTNAEFSLRFENKGNVHLQPRGDIVITNMWGTIKGKIPVNYQTHFGNVLPMSIRDFKFAWNSDFRISDIGRYKAVATLAYGENNIKSISSIAYFWVVPIKATLITLVILISFISLIVWMIRLYVRRMLMLAGVDVENVRDDSSTFTTEKAQKNEKQSKTVRMSYREVAAPLRSGVLDLRRELSQVEESIDVFRTVLFFIQRYKLFFISVCVLIGIFTTIVLYIQYSTDENQNYEVIIDNEGTKTTFDSAELHNTLPN